MVILMTDYSTDYFFVNHLITVSVYIKPKCSLFTFVHTKEKHWICIHLEAGIKHNALWNIEVVA